MSDRNADGVEDSAAGSVRGIDEVVLSAPSSPTVSVFGSFHDGYTGEPIANAAFKISTAKNVVFTEEANDIGGFVVPGVAQGSFIVEATVEGYAPFRAIYAGGVAPGNTDNLSVYVGQIYLFATDATWRFTVTTEDGRPVANQAVYVDVPSGISDTRFADPQGGFNDLTAGVQAQGFRKVVATTNASGVAEVTGVPNVSKLFSAWDGLMTPFSFVRVIVPSIDFNTDGFMDVRGTAQAWGFNNFQYANMNVALTPLQFNPLGAALAPVVTTAGTSGNIIIDDNFNSLFITRALTTTEPVTIIWNQAVDVGSVAMSVLNDWPNRRNSFILDNSTPAIAGQGFPVDKADYHSDHPSGTATLVPAVDPSGTVLTLTPNIPWQAGAEYVLSGQVTAAARGQDNDTGTQLSYVFGDRYAGFRTEPAGPLSIAKVFIERSGTNDGFDNIVIMLSETATGYRTSGNAAHILVCADEDFGVNGRVSTDGNGLMQLDEGECPPADYQLRSTDIGVGLKRALRRTGSAGLTRGAGRYWQITPGQINAALQGRSKVNLRVYINPIVDGQPWAGDDDQYRLNSDVRGDAYQTGTVLSADVTIAPTVSPNAQLDLPSNITPVFQ